MLEQEPLLDATLEKRRLLYAYKTHFITAETNMFGVGDVTDTRLTETIKLNVDAFSLPNTQNCPTCSTGRSLPPKSERAIKLAA